MNTKFLIKEIAQKLGRKSSKTGFAAWLNAYGVALGINKGYTAFTPISDWESLFESHNKVTGIDWGKESE